MANFEVTLSAEERAAVRQALRCYENAEAQIKEANLYLRGVRHANVGSLSKKSKAVTASRLRSTAMQLRLALRVDAVRSTEAREQGRRLGVCD